MNMAEEWLSMLFYMLLHRNHEIWEFHRVSVTLCGLLRASVTTTVGQKKDCHTHTVQLFQFLPVLSLRSVVVACWSHSMSAVSHWPCTGPFSSSLDGRSSSPPSENYTQTCLCQQWGPVLKEEVMVRLYTVRSHNHKTLYQWLLFFHNSMQRFILFSITHWTRMQWK